MESSMWWGTTKISLIAMGKWQMEKRKRKKCRTLTLEKPINLEHYTWQYHIHQIDDLDLFPC